MASIDEATELARSWTNGQGADSTIITVGVLTGEHIGQAFDSIRKAGTVVVTAVAPMDTVGMPISPFMLAMFQKRLQGCLYGMMAPSADVPRLLTMYEQGQLKLDELVSRTYRLEEINTGYEDMYAGSEYPRRHRVLLGPFGPDRVGGKGALRRRGVQRVGSFASLPLTVSAGWPRGEDPEARRS